MSLLLLLYIFWLKYYNDIILSINNIKISAIISENFQILLTNIINITNYNYNKINFCKVDFYKKISKNILKISFYS